MEIRTVEELHKLVSKALEIETSYETIAQWEGYVAVNNPLYRETLFQLISESEKHKNMVQTMLDMIILPKGYQAPSLHQQTFDFRGKSEFDVMLELMRYEQLAFDLYCTVKRSVESTNLEGWIRPEDRASFMKMLDELIRDESEHKEIVTKHVGRVKMIR